MQQLKTSRWVFERCLRRLVPPALVAPLTVEVDGAVEIQMGEVETKTVAAAARTEAYSSAAKPEEHLCKAHREFHRRDRHVGCFGCKRGCRACLSDTGPRFNLQVINHADEHQGGVFEFVSLTQMWFLEV